MKRADSRGTSWRRATSEAKLVLTRQGRKYKMLRLSKYWLIFLLGTVLFALREPAGAQAPPFPPPPGEEPEPAEPQRAPVDESAPLHLQAQQAIERGVDFLLSHQGKDGSWADGDRAQTAGRTSLVGL